MFRVKVLSQLNGRQRGEVRELEDRCKEHDQIQGGISLTGEAAANERPLFFLCYEEDLLAGFATMYQTGDTSAEICTYIHPEFRKRAMYKKMITSVRKEVEKKELQQVYLVHEPRSNDEFLDILGGDLFRYVCSEYLMEWKYSYTLLPSQTLKLQEVEDNQTDVVAELFAGAFSSERETARNRVEALRKEGCRYFLVQQQNVPVGIFCLMDGKESVYVFDFAVECDRQGRGIGKAMLKELIRLVQEETPAGEEPKKILIQVGSRNETAFRLYQKNGFQVTSQRDYYEVCLEALNK